MLHLRPMTRLLGGGPGCHWRRCRVRALGVGQGRRVEGKVAVCTLPDAVRLRGLCVHHYRAAGQI